MRASPVSSRLLRSAFVGIGLSVAPLALSPTRGVISNDACGTDQNVFCCWRAGSGCELPWTGPQANHYEFWGYECP